jgi:hypothetical protein
MQQLQISNTKDIIFRVTVVYIYTLLCFFTQDKNLGTARQIHCALRNTAVKRDC